MKPVTGRRLTGLGLVVLLSACAVPAEDPAEELSRRERDSMIGESRVIPGAKGVKGALEASDSMDARNTLLDSLSKAP